MVSAAALTPVGRRVIWIAACVLAPAAIPLLAIPFDLPAHLLRTTASLTYALTALAAIVIVLQVWRFDPRQALAAFYVVTGIWILLLGPALLIPDGNAAWESLIRLGFVVLILLFYVLGFALLIKSFTALRQHKEVLNRDTGSCAVRLGVACVVVYSGAIAWFWDRLTITSSDVLLIGSLILTTPFFADLVRVGLVLLFRRPSGDGGTPTVAPRG